MASGGRKVDVERRGPIAKSMHRIIHSSVHDQLQFWTSDVSVVETTSRVRNSLFKFSPYIFNYWPLLPTSTSRPPDVIHVTGDSRTSPFFTCSSASVYYTEHKLKNKNGGGLGTRLSQSI